mmetsp:Transcript_25705/g.39493  ORF Transcript_25705/g.39493 Transcript_25705/m.39493 type:complete len:193 (+) Transcript_25705:1240-1818(+)
MLGLKDLVILSGVSKSDPLGLRDSVSAVVSIGGGRKIDEFFVFLTIPGGGSMLVEAERFCGTSRAAYWGSSLALEGDGGTYTWLHDDILDRPEDASERFDTHRLILGVAETCLDDIDDGVDMVSLLADGEEGVIGARAGSGVALQPGGDDSVVRPDKQRSPFSILIEQVIQVRLCFKIFFVPSIAFKRRTVQ